MPSTASQPTLDASHRTATLVARILSQYGVQAAKVLEPQKGYRNTSYPVRLTDGVMANVIIYKNEPEIVRRIEAANRVSDSLWSRGFPARHTYDSRIVCLRTGHAVRFAAFYAYMPGSTIPWEAYTAEHIKLLGKTLSDMHALLAGGEMSDLQLVTDEYDAILGRMQRYFAGPQAAAALGSKLELVVDAGKLLWLRRFLHVCRELPDRQPLHMDFVRGNILFDTVAGSPTVSGVLDFEKVMAGHPLFDVARTLAFLLVDCKYKSNDQVRRHFLLSGYAVRGAARLQRLYLQHDGQTIDVLETLVQLFLLHDFYKFLRHNPYEYLLQNEHFIRTRDLLLEYGLITTPLL